MNDAKYIGLDVHRATISAAVLDSAGDLVMESIIQTKAATILQFIDGRCGSLHGTLEEGPFAVCLGILIWLRRPRWADPGGQMLNLDDSVPFSPR
jgi:hypothetical protein